MPALSIIVPVLDEAAGIAAALRRLATLRRQGAELIVVDGGSSDGTAALCDGLADVVLASPRGRALQMNAGAAAATGRVLLFLHADTQLPDRAAAHIEAALRTRAWGRFDVAIDGCSPWLAVVAAMMNLRSSISGIATGDQAIFVRRDVFGAAGGFPRQPLMEDIELSRRLLRRHGRPAGVRARVVTSGRRWESRGVWRTIWLMWRLRLLYRLGASPERLARMYR